MKRKRIEFFLPGFIWIPFLPVFTLVRSLPVLLVRIARETRIHPIVFCLIAGSFMAGVSLSAWGALHLVVPPPPDIARYNETVPGSSVFPVSKDMSSYCFEVGGFGECLNEEQAAVFIVERRKRNLAQADKFSELANAVKDPRVHSRALYSKGTVYLQDAIDFEEKESLEDAAYALQSSLRDDPAYRDSLDNGNVEFAKDKRINLEIALLTREAVERGWGKGGGREEGEGEGDVGFGAGKSDVGRKP